MKMKNKPKWELKKMKKALSGNLASFLNTKEDEARLKRVNKELRRRSDNDEE